jgi:hypothetical protein
MQALATVRKRERRNPLLLQLTTTQSSLNISASSGPTLLHASLDCCARKSTFVAANAAKCPVGSRINKPGSEQ